MTALCVLVLQAAQGTLPVRAEENDGGRITSPIASVDEDTYMGISMEDEPVLFFKSADAGGGTAWTGNARPRKEVEPTLGIDISKWQNIAQSNTYGTIYIDWDAVKQDGIEFVVIKVGGRYTTDGSLYEDPYYKINISGAQKAGLKVGVYFFSQAVTAAEAKEEAVYTASLIRDYTLQLPVFFDYEWSGTGYRLGAPASVETRTNVCRAFLSTMQTYGYTAGLYSSDSMLNGSEGGSYHDNEGNSTGVDADSLCGTYRLWAARYSANPPGLYYDGIYDLWQYSSSGSVYGIAGDVDMDRWYDDGAYQGGSYVDPFGKIETNPMYRLYNPQTREHLYTKDTNERRVLLGQGWNDEGIAWYAPTKSATPVYRLFNRWSGEHFYTKDANERRVLLGQGWNDEGIGWYSDDGKDVPVYRMFHPWLAAIGSHHYSADVNEYRTLTSTTGGWNDEGIGWYGVGAARRK